MKKLIWLLYLLFPLLLQAQIPNPVLPKELINKPWAAQWIAVAGESGQDYGVYHFRKSFDLPHKPATFLVHVSGDNRYKLYVNGKIVCLGPARSDVNHWVFETVDLAPYLKEGKNTLAAVVWNFGAHKAVPQMSLQTGFIMQGNGVAEQVVNTGKSWKGIKNLAYSPINTNLYTYFVVGPGENVDYNQYTFGWEEPLFNDAAWKEVVTISPGLLGGLFEPYFYNWVLTPRTIPGMEMTPQRLSSVRKVDGVKVSKTFPKQANSFTIPANTKATLLLDQGFETTAYPVLITSGGKGATVALRYAESLFVDEGKPVGQTKNKGNRNEVAGKKFIGYEDRIISDGGANRTFTPLWWRTFRYIEVAIETHDQPLIVQDVYGIYTGYPFKQEARFVTQNAELNKILEVGWRTARLCAHETYMDCPYYEQLQYIGDTRIQALVTLYNTSDDRLVRQAITAIKNSHGLSGITQSRFPSKDPQYIAPFSLWWIGMVNDYWKYRGDAAFIREQLPVSRAIISFFESKLLPDGALGLVPYWNFTDWATAPGWKAGMPPQAAEGQAANLDLQLLLAYEAAAPLEKAAGMPGFADHYDRQIAKLKNNIRALYWDSNKGLLADTPEKKSFSQHANTFAVLAGVVEGEEARKVMEKVLADQSLTQATIYFKYYVHQAVAKAGLGDRYLDLLTEWRKQLAQGLTTWAEQPEPTRSDCHAWGASPNIEFYRLVLGIDSDAPSFSKVKIAPNLGNLKQASGEIPHPHGKVQVNYKVNKSGSLDAKILLPVGIDGVILWQGKEKAIKGGKEIMVTL
ncbi:alpha-L-rhamnosidase N-terminal domain-containing protein [Adhaeribacter aquaticus]|uniref:alpha-L-rhamnosidase-related protein n=1 Tax=Adhaeribacter aquaticus TaxID=299567 RepID=UPI00041455BC|nr:family 78 glycoside hydrolase catalytic domain [Adhaeribacter aquaticus]